MANGIGSAQKSLLAETKVTAERAMPASWRCRNLMEGVLDESLSASVKLAEQEKGFFEGRR
jgi:hypothetical protein